VLSNNLTFKNTTLPFVIVPLISFEKEEVSIFSDKKEEGHNCGIFLDGSINELLMDNECV